MKIDRCENAQLKQVYKNHNNLKYPLKLRLQLSETAAIYFNWMFFGVKKVFVLLRYMAITIW